MTTSGPPSLLHEEDFEAIAEAVMETARGRWFLTEFAKRNRNADTEMLLKAIGRLETALLGRRDNEAYSEGPQELPGPFRENLMEMAQAIARTRHEIAAMHSEGGEASRLINATEELDAIVEATETATSAILTTAEQIQEVAWTMREAGADSASCDKLDRFATEIYTACSFQDLTGQRTGKVVKLLRFLEQRVNAMIRIWGIESDDHAPVDEAGERRPDTHLLNGPALAGQGSSQAEVDMMMGQAAAPAGEPQEAGPGHEAPVQAGDARSAEPAGDEAGFDEAADETYATMADQAGYEEDPMLGATATADPFAEIELVDAPMFPHARQPAESAGAAPEAAGHAGTGTGTADEDDGPDPAIDPRLAADLDAIGVSHNVEAVAGYAAAQDAESAPEAPAATETFAEPEDRDVPAAGDRAGDAVAATQDRHPDVAVFAETAPEPRPEQADRPAMPGTWPEADVFAPSTPEASSWRGGENAAEQRHTGPDPLATHDMASQEPAHAARPHGQAGPDVFQQQDTGSPATDAGADNDGDDELARLAAAIEERLGAYARDKAEDAPRAEFGMRGGIEEEEAPHVSGHEPDAGRYEPAGRADSEPAWRARNAASVQADAADWDAGAEPPAVRSFAAPGEAEHPGHPDPGHASAQGARDEDAGGPEESLTDMLSRLREVHKMAMFS